MPIETDTSRSMTIRVIEKAEAVGASVAGIASVESLKNAPSYGVCRGAVWSAEAKSVLVLALAHEASEPRLDWWDFKAGGNPGNRRLISMADNLTQWLKEECRIIAHPLPYQADKGGIFLKDAATLAGMGVIGKNNLLITPRHGPRVRLRALLLGDALEPNGPVDFNPCERCEMPCRQACPRKAFRGGSYSRALCEVQMREDEANRVTVDRWEVDESPLEVVKYCRACELACPEPAEGPAL